MKKLSLKNLVLQKNDLLSLQEKKYIVGGEWPNGLRWTGEQCLCDWGYIGDANHVEEAPCKSYYCAATWPEHEIPF